MAQVTMLKMDGTEAGSIELKDDIFGIEVNQNAVHAVIVNYLANQRQGTQLPRPEAMSEAGEENPSDKKALAAGDREAAHPPTRSAAESYLHPSPEITDIPFLRS